MKIVARSLFLADLLKLISIRSFTGDEQGIAQCFGLIEAIADRLGFETKRCASGKVLEVFPKNLSRQIKLGIIAHVDTVPFDETCWTSNPLGELSNMRVYGRGSIDDKLGVIYSLYALKELEEEIIPSWKLIVGSSEESRWVDMEEYQKENNIIPEFLFTIDGDGIQNGCRGTLNLELTFRRFETSERFVTIFDTTNETPNIIPAVIYTQVDGSIRSFIGKAAHSSVPENGINAICKAFDTYEDVLSWEFPGFARFMRAYRNEKDGSTVFLNRNPAINYKQKMPPTTVAPTICRLDDDELTLTVNIRLSPKLNKQHEVYESIYKVSYAYCCSLKVKELIMPAYIDSENPEIKLMQDAYEKVIGRRPTSKIALGTGYNAAFENAAIFGPRFDEEDEKEADLCHCTDESRSIEDIVKFYDILKEYIKSSLRK